MHNKEVLRIPLKKMKNDKWTSDNCFKNATCLSEASKGFGDMLTILMRKLRIVKRKNSWKILWNLKLEFFITMRKGRKVQNELPPSFFRNE